MHYSDSELRKLFEDGVISRVELDRGISRNRRGDESDYEGIISPGTDISDGIQSIGNIDDGDGGF